MTNQKIIVVTGLRTKATRREKAEANVRCGVALLQSPAATASGSESWHYDKK